VAERKSVNYMNVKLFCRVSKNEALGFMTLLIVNLSIFVFNMQV